MAYNKNAINSSSMPISPQLPNEDRQSQASGVRNRIGHARSSNRSGSNAGGDRLERQIQAELQARRLN